MYLHVRITKGEKREKKNFHRILHNMGYRKLFHLKKIIILCVFSII